MPLREHCANPVCQATGSFLQASHVGPGAQDEQAPDIFVAAPADPEKIGLAARTALPGNEPNRCRKIATASVLLCVAHFRGQRASVTGPTPGMLIKRCPTSSSAS